MLFYRRTAVGGTISSSSSSRKRGYQQMEMRKSFLLKTKEVYLDTGTLEKPCHDYYIRGQKATRQNGFYGVTTYIGEVLFQKFNRDAAIEKVLTSPRYYKDESYLYYGKTKEEIIEMWDGTSVEGSDVHNIIDDTLKTNDWKNLKSSYPTVCIGLWIFLQSTLKDYIVYASEVALVDDRLKITGCIDALFFNPLTKEFILVDWKSNSVKKDAYGVMGNHPSTKHLPHCKYYQYHCQVNIYAYILEKCYGIKCSRLIVVGFGLNKRKEQVKDEHLRREKDEAVLQHFLRSINKEFNNLHSQREKSVRSIGLAPPPNVLDQEMVKVVGNMEVYEMEIDHVFRQEFEIHREREVDNFIMYK
jgi:hypothetical protein